MFSLFDKNAPYFTVEEQARLVEAIREAEQNTSGEIRIYVEGRNPFIYPIDRSAEIFYKLQMQQTENRNAVLIYVAMRHKELALFADEGIYQRLGKQYWEANVAQMISSFSHDSLIAGLEACIFSIGQALKQEFPFQRNTDKNELPDDIVFGH